MILIAVNYHYVRPSFGFSHDGIIGITPEQLAHQIELLGTVGEFVSQAQIRRAVRGDGALPGVAVALTFDDGFREHVEHALPVLDRMKVPGLFFSNTQPQERAWVSPHHKLHWLRAHVAPERVAELIAEDAARQGLVLDLASRDLDEAATQYRYDEPNTARLKYLLNVKLPGANRDAIVDASFARVFPGAEADISRALYLDRDQLRELARRDALGSHAHRHVALGQVSLESARENLLRARELLREWTGTTVDTYTYPFGSRGATSSAVGKLAADAGYVFGFTMERAVNVDLSEPVHLARFDTNDVPGGKSYRGSVADFVATAARRLWYGASAAA